MAEEPTDWRIQVILDRKALVEDIDKLLHILARQRVIVIISASSREEARSPCLRSPTRSQSTSSHPDLRPEKRTCVRACSTYALS